MNIATSENRALATSPAFVSERSYYEEELSQERERQERERENENDEPECKKDMG